VKEKKVKEPRRKKIMLTIENQVQRKVKIKRKKRSWWKKRDNIGIH